MEVAEAKRLKAFEEENGKLKRLLADAMLDVSTPLKAPESGYLFGVRIMLYETVQ